MLVVPSVEMGHRVRVGGRELRQLREHNKTAKLPRLRKRKMPRAGQESPKSQRNPRDKCPICLVDLYIQTPTKTFQCGHQICLRKGEQCWKSLVEMFRGQRRTRQTIVVKCPLESIRIYFFGF